MRAPGFLMGLVFQRAPSIARKFVLLILLMTMGLGSSSLHAEGTNDVLSWNKLPNLPDKEGFASMFAGVHNGALIVAGGANFPGKRPWEGGTKIWYDTVFALEKPDGEWKTIGKLPRPLGYGVSITTEEGIICIGGSDAGGHHAEVFRLEYVNGSLKTTTLPPLPKPCANTSGALLKNTVYVAGGIETPTATQALNTLWALDLTKIDTGWKELEPMPVGRMLATAGVQEGSFFVFSGAGLKADAEGKPAREWLRDAYRYTPGKGWKRIADLPRVSVAAPSPAPALGQSHLLVMGGDDGAQVSVAPTEHKGFPRDILAYHTVTDTWTTRGEVPFSKVTVPVVEWEGKFIVISGEKQPGIRSPEVWSGEVVRKKKSFSWLNYVTLGLYPIIMLVVSWSVGRKKTSDEFFRGGQKIPWWAVGLSIYATMLSSLTFMAIPAKAYTTDWTFFLANMAVPLLAPLVIAIYLPFFRKLNITSAYEYLEKRFNLAARWFGSASFIVMQLGRTAIVLYLPALALSTVSSFDMRTCILIMGIICILMTFEGGLESVVWTDVVQTVILLLGALVTLVVACMHIPGGAAKIWEVATTDDKLFGPLQWTTDLTIGTAWVILIGNLFSNLIPYTATQDVVQRYVSTKDEKQAARSIWTNALMVVPSTALFFAVGTALYAFYRLNPDRLDPALKNDAIFPLFIVSELPAGLGGLVVAGIFAAAQPTSSLNSIATAWVTDFQARLNPDMNDASRLKVAKWVTVLSGIAGTAIALLMTRYEIASLWDAFLGMLGLTGGALAGLFALGIFTTRAHGVGAMIGAISSVVVLYYVQRHTALHFFTYGAIGILTSFCVGWLASVVIPAERKPLEGLTRKTAG